MGFRDVFELTLGEVRAWPEAKLGITPTELLTELKPRVLGLFTKLDEQSLRIQELEKPTKNIGDDELITRAWRTRSNAIKEQVSFLENDFFTVLRKKNEAIAFEVRNRAGLLESLKNAEDRARTETEQLRARIAQLEKALVEKVLGGPDTQVRDGLFRNSLIETIAHAVAVSDTPQDRDSRKAVVEFILTMRR